MSWHWSEWSSSKTLQTTNAAEDVEKREPFYTVYGNILINSSSHYGEEYGGSLKTLKRKLPYMFLKSHSWACIQRKSESEVTQSCPTLWDTMDYSWNSPVRILEWVAVPFSRGSSQPRDQIQVSYTAGRFFTSSATREAHPEKQNSKRHMHPSVHGSTIYNSQDMEAT